MKELDYVQVAQFLHQHLQPITHNRSNMSFANNKAMSLQTDKAISDLEGMSLL